MKTLKGKALAQRILEDVSEKVKNMNRRLGLAAVLVGDNEASKMYVALKKKAAHKVGIFFSDYVLPQDATQEMIEEVIEHLNTDQDIDGILVQLPLPPHIDTTEILSKICPEKDVDGLTLENMKRQERGEKSFVCPFPQAILELILSQKADIKDAHIFIVGNSLQFIRVLSLLFKKRGCLVEGCIYKKEPLDRIRVAQADIIVSAVGEFIDVHEEDVKDGAIIIDGGIEKDTEGNIRGDFDPAVFKKRDIIISPVPGGVGPVTVACLMRNLVQK
jgi:methylenetetrahydrofolate dehydrogenase (NADP+)/methenyltetrahydrofolate cyclohydrolase